jgi:phage shock protein E
MSRSGDLRVGAGLVLAVTIFLTACSGGTDTATPAATGGSSTGPSWQVLTPVQLHDMMATEKVYLVNVHVPYEGEIAGTDAFIPYTDIASQLDTLPFDKQPVVIYCRSGNMSTEAAQAMVDAGAPPFYELGGGYYAWQDAGYPLQMNQS